MSEKPVFSDDFEWRDARLIHKPTGASFSLAYPNSDSSALSINYGSAGDLLSDGTTYEREDVLRMAQVIFDQRSKKT
jgi:hypothetical protein